jgi:hypothetical protein
MKHLWISFCLFLSSLPLLAQNTSYKDKVDYVFGSLRQSDISTGILLEYGLNFQDPSVFNGTTLSETNKTDIETWRRLYATLLFSVINPSTSASFSEAKLVLVFAKSSDFVENLTQITLLSAISQPFQ